MAAMFLSTRSGTRSSKELCSHVLKGASAKRDTDTREAILSLACVQTSPLPQKKFGRRDDVSSPPLLREGGRLYTGYPLSISGDLPLAIVLAPQNLPEFIVAPQHPNKRCSYCFQTKKVKEGKISIVKPY